MVGKSNFIWVYSTEKLKLTNGIWIKGGLQKVIKKGILVRDKVATFTWFSKENLTLQVQKYILVSDAEKLWF